MKNRKSKIFTRQAVAPKIIRGSFFLKDSKARLHFTGCGVMDKAKAALVTGPPSAGG